MSQRRGVCLSAAVLAIALLTGAVAPDDKELLDATKRGDVAAVRSLLEEGADPNASQGDGLSALHLAAQAGNLDIVKVLIGAGAEVEAKTRIGDYTPLHLASWGAHASAVSALIEAGADPGAVSTTSGVTPLHLAAKATNGESTVRALLEHGAPVDVRESAYGQTPLIFAASYGRTTAIRELLSHGADPATSTEVVDVLKRTVIDKEAQARLQEVATEIRKNSAEGTDRALTLAEAQAAIAAQREFLRSDEAIEQLFEGFNPGDIAVRRPSWTTPSGYSSEVQVDAPPMWETWVGKTGGMTAMLHAAREGYVGAVEALLDGGADIDQVSGNGTSPLLLATLNGQFDLAMMLIERGANPNLATNTDGMSVLFAVLQTQWAGNFTAQPRPKAHETQQSEHMDVLNALLAAGCRPERAAQNAPVVLGVHHRVEAGARHHRCHPVLAGGVRAGSRRDEGVGRAPRRPEHADQVARSRYERRAAAGWATAGGFGAAAHARGHAQHVSPPRCGGRGMAGGRRLHDQQRAEQLRQRGEVLG